MQQCDTNAGSVHHETLDLTTNCDDKSALEQLHVWCQYRPDDSLGSFGESSAEQICEGALQAAEKNSRYLPLLHNYDTNYLEIYRVENDCGVSLTE